MLSIYFVVPWALKEQHMSNTKQVEVYHVCIKWMFMPALLKIMEKVSLYFLKYKLSPEWFFEVPKMVLQWHLWENPLFNSVTWYAQSSSNYLGYLEFSVPSNKWKQADFTEHNITRHSDHAIMLHQLPKSPIGIQISTVFWVSAFNLQPFMHIPAGPKATPITWFPGHLCKSLQ